MITPLTFCSTQTKVPPKKTNNKVISIPKKSDKFGIVTCETYDKRNDKENAITIILIIHLLSVFFLFTFSYIGLYQCDE